MLTREMENLVSLWKVRRDLLSEADPGLFPALLFALADAHPEFRVEHAPVRHLTPAFCEFMILQRRGRLHDVPKPFRSRVLCEAAFARDVGWLHDVPDPDEEIIFRAFAFGRGTLTSVADRFRSVAICRTALSNGLGLPENVPIELRAQVMEGLCYSLFPASRRR